MTCLTCDYPCKVCSTLTACTVCRTPTFELVLGTCKCSGNYAYYSGTNECLALCPLGYYNNSKVCTTCVDPCKTCTGATTCLTCLNDKYLENSVCV